MSLPSDMVSRTSLRVRRALGAAAVAAFAAVSIASCGGGDTATGYQVRAIFDSASFITPGLDVRIAGVSVGNVNDVELTDDNRAAVTFTITKPGFQDMREDARCTIRPQALIGERFIECELTQPRPEGATPPAEIQPIADGPYEGQHLLPVENTAVPVDPDQLLNLNTASVRDRFAIIIRELGAGVAGRGDEIAATLRKTNDALTYANRILKQLSDQEDMLKELVTSSDRTLASLATERDSLSGTVSNGAVVASRLAARKGELQASIASLNQLLDEVGPTVDKVDDLATELQPIADDLNRSADDTATILNELPELSEKGTSAITALGPTVNRAGDILTSDTNDALIDRLVKTSSAVKASGSVLGLALGDFRTTGGLDYFLDAIYGLAYSLNGRDENGYYLRGALQNIQSCGTAPKQLSSGCSGSAQDALPAAGSRNAAAASGSDPKPTTPSPTQAAADLLLGGGQ
ncbi:MAG: MCE family protein [Solirubrobacteraceae bacterium]|nr:MCE family protein [Solirubrobacteraceae bacterium]